MEAVTTAPAPGNVTGETTEKEYELQVNHTLLYKAGMFILSLLLVIVLALNLTAYDDIGDGSGTDGINIDTANSYAGLTRVALGFAVAYFIYRAIILIIDPTFKEKFVKTTTSIKTGLGAIKTGLGQLTPSIPKVSLPSLSSLPSLGIGSKSTAGKCGLVYVNGIVPQILIC